MSVKVPLERVRDELEQRANRAYLLTVGDDGRPHCAAVVLGWREDELVVGAGRTSASNAAARRQVTLLAPPTTLLPALGEPSGGQEVLEGYSLIVDGDVTAVPVPATSGNEASGDEGSGGRSGGGEVRVRPTHAVLHRPATAPDGGRAHDCVPVYGEAGPQR